MLRQHPADRCQAASHDGGDGAHWHTRTAQLHDPSAKCRIDGAARPVRPGAAVKQVVQSGFPVSTEPFAGGAHADAGGQRGWFQSHRSNTLDKQFAPFVGGSGILMAVHPVGPLGVLKRRELQFPRSFRVNNLLKHHS